MGNVLPSKVTREIDGRCHALTFRTYAVRYLAEATWRFNRRCGLAEIANDPITLRTTSTAWPERALRRGAAVSHEEWYE